MLFPRKAATISACIGIRLVYALAALCLILVVVAGITFLYVAWQVPSVVPLKTSEGLQSLFSRHQSAPHLALPILDNLPPHVIHSFIAANDPGKDVRSNGAANAFTRRLSHVLFTADAAKYGHAEGFVMQIKLRLLLTRDEILAAWLAVAYFGNGIFGVDAAAHTYFQKPSSELTLCESVTLAALSRSPRHGPWDDPALAKHWQHSVLDAMAELGLADDAALAACR